MNEYSTTTGDSFHTPTDNWDVSTDDTLLLTTGLTTPENETTWRTILASCFICAIVISGVVGNAVIIASVVRDHRLHTRGNFLIASLALTDFLVSMMVCPFFAWQTFNKNWHKYMWSANQDPELACSIFIFLDVTCCTASIIHLCAIAHDRYRAVTDLHYRAKCSFKRLTICVVLIWVGAVILSVIPLILEKVMKFYTSQTATVEALSNATTAPMIVTATTGGKVEETTGYQGDPAKLCMVFNDKIYRVVATTVAFYAPLVFIVVIYARVATIAWSRIHTVVASPSDDRTKQSKTKRIFVLINRPTSIGFFPLKSLCFGRKYRRNQAKPRTDQITKLQCCIEDTSSSSTVSMVNSPLGGGTPHQNVKTRFKEANDQEEEAAGEYGNFLTVGHAYRGGPTMPSCDVMIEASGAKNECYEAELSSLRSVQNAMEMQSAPVHLNSCNKLDHEHDDDETKQQDNVQTNFTRLSQDFLSAAKTACASATGRDVSSRSRIMMRREKKLIKTMGLIIGAFVICWLPFFLKELIIPFCDSCNLDQNTEAFINWLGYFNSALNPFIYAFTNQEISRAIRSTFKRFTPSFC